MANCSATPEVKVGGSKISLSEHTGGKGVLYAYVGLSELSLCAQVMEEATERPARPPVPLLMFAQTHPQAVDPACGLPLPVLPAHLQQSVPRAAHPGGSSNVRPPLGTAPTLTAGHSSLSTR